MQDETVSRALYDAMRMALKDIEAVLARHGCPPGATMTDWVDEQLTALAAATKPVDMLLLCPNCGVQHIDAVETGTALSRSGLDSLTETEVVTWSNPPHRSHMCHSCGHQWRPADVATNGVAELKTKGKNDSPRVVREIEPFAQCPHGDNVAKCSMCARPRRPTPAQEKALDEMVADAQRLGLYDMPNPAAPVAKPLNYEQRYAIREGHLNLSEGEFFAARPDFDCGQNRRMFGFGFMHGYDKGMEEAAQSGKRSPTPNGLRGFSPRGDFAVELRFHSCRLAQAYLHDIAAQIANNMSQETAQ